MHFPSSLCFLSLIQVGAPLLPNLLLMPCRGHSPSLRLPAVLAPSLLTRHIVWVGPGLSWCCAECSAPRSTPPLTAVAPAAPARPGSPAQMRSWGCESSCPSRPMSRGLSDPECQLLHAPRGSQGVTHPQPCPLDVQAGSCPEALLWVTGKELSRRRTVPAPSPGSSSLSSGTGPAHLHLVGPSRTMGIQAGVSVSPFPAPGVNTSPVSPKPLGIQPPGRPHCVGLTGPVSPLGLVTSSSSDVASHEPAGQPVLWAGCMANVELPQPDTVVKNFSCSCWNHPWA